MAVRVAVRMVMRMLVLVLQFLLGDQSVRNQMQERVTEQTAGREAQQHLEQRLVFVRTVDRDEVEYQVGSDRDQQCAADGAEPDLAALSVYRLDFGFVR